MFALLRNIFNNLRNEYLLVQQSKHERDPAYHTGVVDDDARLNPGHDAGRQSHCRS